MRPCLLDPLELFGDDCRVLDCADHPRRPHLRYLTPAQRVLLLSGVPNGALVTDSGLIIIANDGRIVIAG